MTWPSQGKAPSGRERVGVTNFVQTHIDPHMQRSGCVWLEQRPMKHRVWAPGATPREE